jgi:RHS repeat-associated protein
MAICDQTGNIQERYIYDAFGKQDILSPIFVQKTTTEFNWNRTFTGQVLDNETGLMLYRNRFYHVGLGKFVNRDPIGYQGGDKNLYRYVFNFTTNLLDEDGLIPLVWAVECLACATCLGPAAVVCRGQNSWSGYTKCLQIAYNGTPFVHRLVCEEVCESCLTAGAGKLLKCVPKKRPPKLKPPTTSNHLPDTPPKLRKQPKTPKQPDTLKQPKPHKKPQPQRGCNPCIPPVGTLGFRTDHVPPSKEHAPYSGTHTHHYEMHQSPWSVCRCFWHDLEVTDGSSFYPEAIRVSDPLGGGVE